MREKLTDITAIHYAPVVVLAVFIALAVAIPILVLVPVPIIAIIIAVFLFFLGQIINRIVEVSIVTAVANLVLRRSSFAKRSRLLRGRAGQLRGRYSSLVFIVIVTVAIVVFIVAGITISPVVWRLRVEVADREAGRRVFTGSR